jgi:hypothetical protein
MFCKNEFKERFRIWAQSHLDGSDADAFEFCQELIPQSRMSEYYWLVEQSVGWFKWLKSQVTPTRDLTEEEEATPYAQPIH